MGDLQGAMQVAQFGLSHRQHDGLAGFMYLLGHTAGAHVALMGLQGLTVQMQAELCMAVGQWRRALACCQVLMMGGKDKTHSTALPGRQSYTGAAGMGLVSDTRTSLTGGLAAVPEQTQQSQNQSMWGLMGFGGLYVDNFSTPEAAGGEEGVQEDKSGKVDWNAALSSDWSFQESAAVSQGDKAKKQSSSSNATAASALAPQPSAVSLSLRLVDDSHQAGIWDVTVGAMQLLLQHKGLLQPAQLARLAAKMAESGMGKEIVALADSSVASGSHQGQAVGFVAAALTGDLERLQKALKQSNTAALAALQANTFRLSSALQTEKKWNEALQSACCQMAAHPTNSYAYFMVTPGGL